MKRSTRHLLRWLSGPFLVVALVVILPLRVWCQPELRIGLQKQLLVDDHVIDTRSHLKRTPGRVVKANQCRPLLIPNQPWEEPEAFGYYGSVLYDQGKFRMWYRADIREESRSLGQARFSFTFIQVEDLSV